MRTFVTFVNGYQEVENMQEALSVAAKNPLTIDIVEIDESRLPDDVQVECCINCHEDEAIKRITPKYYAIIDTTANTGREYIGEGNRNVHLEENAVRYASYEEAEKHLQEIDPENLWGKVIEL